MYFHSKRSDNTKNFSSSMKLDVRLEQIRSCVVLKDAIAKNFVANEHHSFTSVFTFSVVVVDLPTDCILSFLFPAETDVLVPVLSQSTDVVVVNFVVVLKFPIVQTIHCQLAHVLSEDDFFLAVINLKPKVSFLIPRSRVIFLKI